jgi:hypothetical protein
MLIFRRWEEVVHLEMHHHRPFKLGPPVGKDIYLQSASSGSASAGKVNCSRSCPSQGKPHPVAKQGHFGPTQDRQVLLQSLYSVAHSLVLVQVLLPILLFLFVFTDTHLNKHLVLPRSVSVFISG